MEYEVQEKFGFVYIWFDRKRTRFYIGCHWGTEDDGYICSSTWMRNSYKRRPEDFKRRIISRIYTSKVDTFAKETEWLLLIKKEEFGKRYYNKGIWKTWYHDGDKTLTTSEKISKSFTEERRKKLSLSKMGDKNPSKRPEVVEKRLQTIKKNGGLVAWNKGIPATEESKLNHSRKMKGRQAPNKGVPMSAEQKKKLSEYQRNMIWINNGIKNIRLSKDSEIPENWFRGRTKNRVINGKSYRKSTVQKKRKCSSEHR